MNKVLMKINAHQESADGQEDVMELLTIGNHYNKNGIVYLMYEETELSGMKGCVTALKIDGDVVKLRRYGTQSREMHFEKGKKYWGVYETPIGFVDMEILTNEVDNRLRRDGSSGTVVINYEVSLKGLLEAHNTLEVKVAKIPPKRK